MYNSLYCEELRIYIGNDLTAFDDILTEKLWTLRERLFEETGFIMPAVRIMSEDILQENEYRIAVRGIVVYTGYAIFNADFAPDEIAKSLEDTLTQHIDDVFSNSVVEKYIDYVQTESHRLVSALLAVTDIAALRVILTNL